MNKYGNEILLVMATELPELEPHTIVFYNLASITCTLTDNALSISFYHYLNKVNRLRDQNSSGPSDVTPVHGQNRSSRAQTGGDRM